MRRLLASPVLALAIFGLSLVVVAPGVVRADPRDFTLVNDSTVVIREAYVSSSAKDSWDEDVLGNDVLRPGNRVNVTFTGFTPGDCSYDIKVVGMGGETGFLWAVDLCSTAIVTFSN
jgi:hypothetical protein